MDAHFEMEEVVKTFAAATSMSIPKPIDEDPISFTLMDPICLPISHPPTIDNINSYVVP